MVTDRSAWIDEAACAVDPLREVRAWDYDVTKYRAEAAAVCASCPVRAQCYEDAVADSGSEGMRGGVIFKVRSARRGKNASEGDEVHEL